MKYFFQHNPSRDELVNAVKGTNSTETLVGTVISDYNERGLTAVNEIRTAITHNRFAH